MDGCSQGSIFTLAFTDKEQEETAKIKDFHSITPPQYKKIPLTYHQRKTKENQIAGNRKCSAKGK